MFANAASYLLLAAAALHPVLAGVYITSPVDSTAATGGQVIEVKWADDGKTPTVASVGPCSIDIYTGSVNNQIKLQNLAASVDVSKASSISATIDPSIGQDDSHYFVRFTSLNLKDAKNPQYPYEAFSAMFTISSMSGKFNATTLAAIDAAASSNATLPVSGATADSSNSTTGTVKSSTATNGTKSSSSSSASSTSAKSGALPQLAAPATLALALVGAASYFVL
ncbi:hypothetical protein CI109_103092 [Kwoniella shandongensis]|uniref:Uncharacterized protein n=1 Tax=Kwoniella shandongensis TaxID=1734106 RepID=A0A5M6CC87_9TREE|nr:uncharacterized protein CI109_000283 [Kwoniella shandongensis]KAA5531442.1 hypothetical protein CI109_000283 [Kwoniella shandongensis]